MDVVDALRDALPADGVVDDPDRLASYRNDQAPGVAAGTPVAVVLPRSTAEVSQALQVLHAHRTPVVPRGAGSGLSGGANAVDGGVVLSLERMTAIFEIDAADGVAVVQPGVVNDVLRATAREHGLFYAPDPSSRDWCSIGGNVATNAGGLCCVKYGVTRDSVLALEVVLADGRVVRVGHRSIKGVAGYDLVGLFVGSEGTLGVVTEVTVRLRPLPPPAVTVVGVMPDLDSAGAGVARVVAAGTPSLLEMMDRTTIRAVESWKSMGLDTDAAALLLAQSDLPGAAGQEEAEAFRRALDAAGALESYCSESEQESDQLLMARRLAIPALEQLGDTLLDDVAVPRGRVGDLVAAVTEIADRRQVVVATFGHAGDGNFHPTFVTPRGDVEAASRARIAFDEVLLAGLALGGTVTGEHGVGSLKRGTLQRELHPVAAELHRAVKAALDPSGILNPGKALPLD